jgi:hypothetical protein
MSILIVFNDLNALYIGHYFIKKSIIDLQCGNDISLIYWLKSIAYLQLTIRSSFQNSAKKKKNLANVALIVKNGSSKVGAKCLVCQKKFVPFENDIFCVDRKTTDLSFTNYIRNY